MVAVVRLLRSFVSSSFILRSDRVGLRNAPAATVAASFPTGLGTVPERSFAVLVVVAAWPDSCRGITYVAGSCSRARALRAAADGCAV